MKSPNSSGNWKVALAILLIIIIGGAVYFFSSPTHTFPSLSLLTASSTQSSSRNTYSLVIPTNGVLLGVHIDPEDNATDEAGFTALEGQLGRNLAIFSDYNDWNPNSTPVGFPNTTLINWATQHNLLVMISWRPDFTGADATKGCATAADIIAGKYDAQLTQQADAIKALEVPILVRWNYEMTGNEYNTCFNNGVPLDKHNMASAGTNYIDSWKHIVDIFRAQGATNVQWVWAPGAGLFNTSNWKLFYPGGDYVDWIAEDNYNKTDTPESYATDPSIVAFYAQVSGLGKPLMQSEIGADHDSTKTPDAQTVYIQTAETALKTQFPDFKAFIWWDSANSAYSNAHPGSGTGYQLQGPGLTAFTQMANDSHFTALPFPNL